MPPAHQQQKRPYYAAIILIACAFWLWHLRFD
jgi:predicted signal transduction protein with EAL and GGDEF domain